MFQLPSFRPTCSKKGKAIFKNSENFEIKLRKTIENRKGDKYDSNSSPIIG